MTILMGICAGRDVAAAPLKHFVVQTLVFTAMAAAASFSVSLGPWLAIPVNLTVIFCVLYAYTYEYSHHLYFPYILSYLFLLYISPVAPAQLPKRLVAVVVCSACMILYALALGFRNIRKPARNALTVLTEEASRCLDCLLRRERPADRSEACRRQVYALSRNADNRRKGLLSVQETALAVLDAGRGLEYLALYLHEPQWLSDNYPPDFWQQVASTVSSFRLFIRRKTKCLAEIDKRLFLLDGYTLRLCDMLIFIRANLLASSGSKKRARPKPADMPLSVKLKTLFGYSPVRLIYAVRVTLLLTLFIIPVQYFHLAHGKWLLFTLASVSLPYADDVANKGVKRMAATLLGGAIAAVLFGLIGNTVGRTAVLMLSGYLSFYFAEYTGNYSCATIGALGGAMMTATGWTSVGITLGIRVGYIAVGIAIAFVVNVVICPYRRKNAAEKIYRKYYATAQLLSDGIGGISPSVYYEAVIGNNLLEEKLLNDAGADADKVRRLTREYRRKIIRAHHDRKKGSGA